MDFPTPPAVIEALTAKAQHGIFGYSDSKKDYEQTLQNWFQTNFNWQIQPEHLIKTPGIVYALCTAIRALTNKGDAIIIQQPVYYPFAASVTNNQRQLIVNQLLYSQDKYSIDFAAFEEQIVQNQVKLFILCNPHNPVGRVWTKEELTQLGNICLKHGVIIIADEIHADFVYPGHKHLVFADLEPAFADITITCTAPSKTFNLAGLQISNIFINNQTLRQKFNQQMAKSGYSQVNIMGIVACQAAYNHGQQWLDQLKIYLAGNLSLIRSFLQEKLPQIKLVEPEGTYLLWLDFKALELDSNQLNQLITNKAKLWLNAGETFGLGGTGFQRINIACPRSTIEKALHQLEQAINT